MKKQLLCWLLILIMILSTACTEAQQTEQETQAAEEQAVSESNETAAPLDADQAELAARPGREEQDLTVYSDLSGFGAALGTFVGSTGYSIATTTSTEKSTLYTITDGEDDLALVRVYTVDNQIDHFFIKFSYSWAHSDSCFDFVLRLLKFCTRSTVSGLDNDGYAAMSQALGLTDTAGMAAYSTYTSDFASNLEWTLTKGVGTLKTTTYTDDRGNSYELGFYIIEKKNAGEPNYFAFTVTPAQPQA